MQYGVHCMEWNYLIVFWSTVISYLKKITKKEEIRGIKINSWYTKKMHEWIIMLNVSDWERVNELRIEWDQLFWEKGIYKEYKFKR